MKHTRFSPAPRQKSPAPAGVRRARGALASAAVAVLASAGLLVVPPSVSQAASLDAGDLYVVAY